MVQREGIIRETEKKRGVGSKRKKGVKREREKKTKKFG